MKRRRSARGETRLVVLAVHPEQSAATRLRALQYLPEWRTEGFAPRVWTFVWPRLARPWISGGWWARALITICSVPRVPLGFLALRAADVVLVQREALPFGPPWLESWAARRAPVVWDLDDALWERPRSPMTVRVPGWLRVPGGKFEGICRMASDVWAGSDYLAEWCRRHGAKQVEVVPTVIDVPATPGPVPEARTVGWIGSPPTAHFLDQVLPALTEIDPPPHVVVVGGDVRPPAGLEVDQRAWTKKSEEDALRAIRVGLNPLDRSHPLSEGKCGFKAVLSMSRGIPVVITPTAANAVIVRHGEEGLHAETREEWAEAVSRLLRDEDLWERCSRAAHRRAAENYSRQRWAPILATRLRELATRQPHQAEAR